MQRVPRRWEVVGRSAVERIAYHRAAEQGEVDAYLVGDARTERRLDEGASAARVEEDELGAGGPGAKAGGRRDHAPAVAGIVRQGSVDRGACRRGSRPGR